MCVLVCCKLHVAGTGLQQNRCCHLPPFCTGRAFLAPPLAAAATAVYVRCAAHKPTQPEAYMFRSALVLLASLLYDCIGLVPAAPFTCSLIPLHTSADGWIMRERGGSLRVTLCVPSGFKRL